MIFTFPHEFAGDDAELSLVLECLPVGVGGGRDEHRVDLVLAGSPTLLTFLLTLHMNLIKFSCQIESKFRNFWKRYIEPTHPVEDIVHTLESLPPADVVLPDSLVPTHGVEPRSTLRIKMLITNSLTLDRKK